jgi:hypothetical protein
MQRYTFRTDAAKPIEVFGLFVEPGGGDNVCRWQSAIQLIEQPAAPSMSRREDFRNN